MAGYRTSFSTNWYCCACKHNKGGLLQSPNFAYSTTCEDPSCSHPRCNLCEQSGGAGLRDRTSIPRKQKVALSDSPPQPIPLDQNEMETEDTSLSPRASSQSSRSSSVTEHQAALSSSYNTRGVTEVYTDVTTVSNAAKTADFRHLDSNDSDNESVASSIDQLYPGFSTVLGNNLVQDLKDVDLARCADMLAARLEEFSLRFGNEDADVNHLRMMSIAYRHSRYESPSMKPFSESWSC